MESDRQFRRRTLLVDSDDPFLQVCSDLMRKQGYEVLTAADGFAALCALRGAYPDVLIAELNLAHMSGFELLSVVRTRFPHIAVIAISGEYTAVTVPNEAICDAFLEKGPNFHFDLIEEALRLIKESPLRSSRAKSEMAPVWIPRSRTGYIVLTCPECLRSFSAMEPGPGTSTEICVCCGANVPFVLYRLPHRPNLHKFDTAAVSRSPGSFAPRVGGGGFMINARPTDAYLSRTY